MIKNEKEIMKRMAKLNDMAWFYKDEGKPKFEEKMRVREGELQWVLGNDERTFEEFIKDMEKNGRE